MRLLNSSFKREKVSGKNAVSGRTVFPAFLAGFLLLAFTTASCGGGKTPEFDGERAFLFLEEQCDIGYRYPGSPAFPKPKDRLHYLKAMIEELDRMIARFPVPEHSNLV